jgi:hypothetical protein
MVRHTDATGHGHPARRRRLAGDAGGRRRPSAARAFDRRGALGHADVDAPGPPGRPLEVTMLRSRRLPVVTALLVILAFVAAACGPSTPALSDPAEILQAGAASLGEMETAHLRGTVDGQLPLDIGGAAAGAPVPLDGTTLEADFDVAAGALALQLLMPALLNLRLDLVVVDGQAYLKAPIVTGESWVRQPLEGGAAADPGASLGGLAEFLANPDLAPERLPDVRCAGTDCYSVRFTVPAADIRAALGALGGAIPGLSADRVGDATVTAGVRKDNQQLATLALEIPVGETDPLAVALELSKVNEPVTIEAPPPDEVKDAPGGLLGG